MPEAIVIDTEKCFANVDESVSATVVLKCRPQADEVGRTDRRRNSIMVSNNESWGFRITGGCEFGMPITVFQVTDGGRAQQAGIQLGDSIVKINDEDTSEMSLGEAHKRIQDAGDDLKLSVKNFEEEEEAKVNQAHDVELERNAKKAKDAERARLEETLRTMQRRLSQIAQIPLIIQTTLDAVAKSFDEFLPPEPAEETPLLTLIDLSTFVGNATEGDESPEKCVDIDGDDALDLEANVDASEVSLFTPELSPEPVTEPTPEPEPEPEPTEEEIQRIEKIQKVEKLDRTWPWGNQDKVIYKRSNCHLVSKTDSVQTRISKFNVDEIRITAAKTASIQDRIQKFNVGNISGLPGRRNSYIHHID